MVPPGPPEKRLSPLETKLETLRGILAELIPIWMNYDPAAFMETTHHMQKWIDDLTCDTIEHLLRPRPTLFVTL